MEQRFTCHEYVIRETGAIFDKYMARMDAGEAERRKDDALLEECLKEMNRIADRAPIMPPEL
jgi:hypothetical protein